MRIWQLATERKKVKANGQKVRSTAAQHGGDGRWTMDDEQTLDTWYGLAAARPTWRKPRNRADLHESQTGAYS